MLILCSFYLGLESEHQPWGPWTTVMETESEQNSNSTNGSSSSGGSSRPQIAQMSLYERQAVQVRLNSEGLRSVSTGLGQARVLEANCP